MIENFDDLVQMALGETDPPQLLTVLVRAESMHSEDDAGRVQALEGEGVLKPIMVKSRSVTPELQFEHLKAEAEALDNRWAFMMLAVLPGCDGKPPAPADVDENLKHMARTLLTGGDLERYLFIDRDGDLVQVSAATASGLPEIPVR